MVVEVEAAAAVEAVPEPGAVPEPAFVVQVASVLEGAAVPEPELVESETTSPCYCLDSRQSPSRLRCSPVSGGSSLGSVTVN